MPRNDRVNASVISRPASSRFALVVSKPDPASCGCEKTVGKASIRL